MMWWVLAYTHNFHDTGPKHRYITHFVVRVVISAKFFLKKTNTQSSISGTVKNDDQIIQCHALLAVLDFTCDESGDI